MNQTIRILFILLAVGGAPCTSFAVPGDDMPAISGELKKYVDEANLTLKQGLYDDAQAAAQAAIKVADKEYKNEPERAETYNLMAMVQFAKGDFVNAFKYHNAALVIMKKVYGDNHPRYAQLLVSRAGTYTAVGLQEKKLGQPAQSQFRSAERDLLVAEKIFKVTRKENDPWLAMTQSGLDQVKTLLRSNEAPAGNRPS